MRKTMSDENSEFANDFIFKICCIGDGAVGKTSLIKRFTQGSFNKEYIKTLGAQFSRYERIVGENKEIRVRLFFWDIAGQSEFNFMRPTFYNGAKATIVVFDLSRPETLASVETWYKDITQYVGNIPTIVFGNKCDLIEEENYDDSGIQDLVNKYSFLNFYKTSAKTGEQVEQAFNSIIDVLVDQHLQKKPAKEE
jgi:small GTP-binding protein